MPHFFITGTDTGVGKTWFTAWLLHSWRAQGHLAAGLKPISTGDREDARLLQAAAGHVLPLDEINPFYFRQPAAPLVSAQAEKRSLDFAALNLLITEKRTRFSHLAVEGVGGWRVPLAPGYEIRDWVRDLELPVVVVARAGLGTLNHTLLTVESIRANGLTCSGIILNSGPNPSPDLDLARLDNHAVLFDLLGLPIFDFHRLAQAAGKVPVWLGGEEI